MKDPLYFLSTFYLVSQQSVMIRHNGANDVNPNAIFALSNARPAKVSFTMHIFLLRTNYIRA